MDDNSQVDSVAIRLLSHDIVTPKGVLLLAVCDASATREDLWASSRGNLPIEKYMW
jgi:hypothetical protein